MLRQALTGRRKEGTIDQNNQTTLIYLAKRVQLLTLHSKLCLNHCQKCVALHLFGRLDVHKTLLSCDRTLPFVASSLRRFPPRLRQASTTRARLNPLSARQEHLPARSILLISKIDSNPSFSLPGVETTFPADCAKDDLKNFFLHQRISALPICSFVPQPPELFVPH